MYYTNDGTRVFVENGQVYLEVDHIEVPDINITINDVENLIHLLEKVEEKLSLSF